MDQAGTEFESDSGKSVRWLIWTLFLLLALIIHVLIFRIPWEWTPLTAPPRVEIQQIDPRKLDAIRKQWKDENEFHTDTPDRKQYDKYNMNKNEEMIKSFIPLISSFSINSIFSNVHI